MFTRSISTSLLAVGGAIALSLLSKSPAFSKSACPGTEAPANHTPATPTRTVVLRQFGIQVKIPSNFRALLYNNGTVAILPPGDFKLIQCLAQGIPVHGTDAVQMTTFQIHPNPKKLRADEFAQEATNPYLSDLQKHRINQIDLSVRESVEQQGNAYGSFHGWYQRQEIAGIVEVSARTEAELLNVIKQAQLIGVKTENFDQILQEAFKTLKTPSSPSRVTISRVNDRGENPTQSTITITEAGYLDDSVHGQKTIIQMNKLPNGSWTTTDIQKLYLCQPGRGSQSGSTKPCF